MRALVDLAIGGHRVHQEPALWEVPGLLLKVRRPDLPKAPVVGGRGSAAEPLHAALEPAFGQVKARVPRWGSAMDPVI